jgi:hypothetical protein
MIKAWKRVKSNGGSAEEDGLTFEDTIKPLRTDWPRIKEDCSRGATAPCRYAGCRFLKPEEVRENSGYRP